MPDGDVDGGSPAPLGACSYACRHWSRAVTARVSQGGWVVGRAPTAHDYRSGMSASRQAPDRNLALELVRVTEAAAMAAARWMGRGDKNGADEAATNAMRAVLEGVAMDGIVVIGEGEKDDAPMLFNGEQLGDGSPPSVDIAVDPLEGTTLTALGRANALAVIALSDRGTMFDPGPCFYMEKIAVGAEAAGAIDITKSPTDNLKAVAQALGR